MERAVKTWLISDTHFGEQPPRRILKSGADAATLDAMIIANWRSQVKPQDIVWHLGDIGKNWRVLADLPGTKHLILAHASDRRPAIANSGLFASIQETVLLDTPGGQLTLVHDPSPWSGEVRCDIVHGHFHYDLPERGRRCVCVDQTNWGPISLDDVMLLGSAADN